MKAELGARLRAHSTLVRLILWGTVAVLTCFMIFTMLFEPSVLHFKSDVDDAVRADRYYTWKHYVAAMGRPIKDLDPAGDIGMPPADGVLIIGAAEQRRTGMSPLEVRRLFNWVNGGGHLVFEALPGTDDSLALAFGIESHPVKQLSDELRQAKGAGHFLLRENSLPIRVPGRDLPLRAALPYNGLTLDAHGQHVAWRVSSASGTYILHIERGRGAVTVVHDLQGLIGNDSIEMGDNATLFWVIVNLVNPHGPILMQSAFVHETWWQWLVDSGLPMLVSGAVLLVLWLAAVAPRFGPISRPPVLAQRSLADHLQAMGQAVWRADESDGLAYWLAGVRRLVLERAASIDPAMHRLNPVDQARRVAGRLSASTALSEASIRAALAGRETGAEGAELRRSFTRVIAILQQLNLKIRS